MNKLKVLVLGSTGMLGKSLMTFFNSRDIFVQGIARENSDYNFDVVEQLEEVLQLIKQNAFNLVINTVASINLYDCEQQPAKAYMVNTYIAGEIAKVCSLSNIYFVQISTDHYYVGHDDLLHSEEAEIVLLNEYAKTKFLAEKLVGLYSNTLIVRTNIVGFRRSGSQTFVEWILETLQKDEEIIGYQNMYTSSIDVDSFSKILYEILKKRETGIWNIAADGVISKYNFIKQLADKISKGSLVKEGYLEQGNVKRANSLGLSIEKLKKGYPSLEIPTANQVIDTLLEQYKNEEK